MMKRINKKSHSKSSNTLPPKLVLRKQIDESIQQSEKQFGNILESISDAFFTLDRKWNYTYLNSKGAKLVGKTVPELLGKNIWKEFPEAVSSTFYRIYHRVMKTGKSEHFEEYYVPLKTWYACTVYPSQDGISIFYQDITEHKQAEEIRSRLVAIVESSDDAIIGANLDGIVTSWNDGAEKIYGYSAKEMIGKKISTVYPSDRSKELSQILRNIKQGKGIKNHESVRIRKDGKCINVFLTLSPIRDNTGKIIGVSAITRDITERKQTEAELDKHRYHLEELVKERTSQLENANTQLQKEITERKKKETELIRVNRILKALSESNKEMMRATDELKYLQEVCEIVVKDCGYKMVWIGFAEDDEAKSVRPVAYAGFEKGYLDKLKISWADTERGRGPTGRAIRTGKMSLCRNMLTDPDFKPWRAEAIKRSYASSVVLPLMAGGKAFGAINIYSPEPDPFSKDEIKLLDELASDLTYGITALRLRTAKKESEEEYNTVIRTSIDGFWITDMQGNFLDVNNAYCGLIGYSRAELLKMSIRDVEAIEKPEETIRHIQKLIKTGWDRFETQHRHKDSRIIDLEVSATYLNIKGGRLVVFLRDITERKKAEKEIISLSRFPAENPNPIMRIASNGILLYFNKASLFLVTEWKYQIGNIVSDEWYGWINAALKSGVSSEIEIKVNGKILLFVLAPVVAEGYVNAYGRDITARRQMAKELEKYRGHLEEEVKEKSSGLIEMQRRLADSERLAALGQLSAGIVHEINNPLYGITNYVEVLKGEALAEEQKKYLSLISQGIDMIKSTTSDLLNVAQVDRLELGPVNITEIIKDVVAFLKHRFDNEGVTVKTVFPNELPLIQADKNKIKQVFFNLLTNSLEAVADNGKIDIRTVLDSNNIKVFVTDNGFGITPEKLPHIFKPFISGKKERRERGIGLGLFMVSSIISAHKGSIEVESTPGQGTTFTISLPR